MRKSNEIKKSGRKTHQVIALSKKISAIFLKMVEQLSKSVAWKLLCYRTNRIAISNAPYYRNYFNTSNGLKISSKTNLINNNGLPTNILILTTYVAYFCRN